MGDGIFRFAAGQARRGQALPGGYGLRAIRALQPLTVSQRARQQPDRRRGVSRGLISRGQLVCDAESIWMAGA